MYCLINNMYCLIKLRTSSHKLAIETGRWHRPHIIPIENRLCNVCHKLDDEYHFILECTRHIELRQKYIPIYYFTITQVTMQACDWSRAVK